MNDHILHNLIMVVVLVFLLAGASVFSSSHVIAATGDPVNGKAQYTQKCAVCHGENGDGQTGPTLTGCLKCDSLDNLSEKINDAMPKADPSSCIDACADDTAAYIFSEFNKRAIIPDPDVSMRFDNDGLSSYVLESVTPENADIGIVGGEDTTLAFKLNKRYQISVINFSAHPFEIIAKASSYSNDIVLLSMKGGGSMEEDAGVEWTYDGVGTASFVLTQTLYDAMTAEGNSPGYRCGIHVATMRGDITVSGIPIADPIPDAIEKGDFRIGLKRIASGLTAPVGLIGAGGGTDKIYILEQTGKVLLLENGELNEEPFLDVSGRLVDINEGYDERGLLGMAFHPDYHKSGSVGYGKFYTYTSEPVSGKEDFFSADMPEGVEQNHYSIVTEWQANVETGDVNTEDQRVLMKIAEPQSNHNGGDMHFGPDGHLYIALGDGGKANDVGDGHGASGNGQNLNTILGSIIRIDPIEPSLTPASADFSSITGNYRIPRDNPFVGGDDLEEIYAYGFRNPYRFSFDSQSGDLIAADVGQGKIEEVDIVTKGGNYGWNLMEGSYHFNPETGTVSSDITGLPTNLINPVLEYDHDEGASIIGGFVYRGGVMPELNGYYVFSDFSGKGGGRVFYGDLKTGVIKEFRIADDNNLPFFIKGMGEDGDGELYLLTSENIGPKGDTGKVFKLVKSPVPDIRANGSDGPLTLALGETVKLSLSLDSIGESEGVVDWWIYADTPFGRYYFHYPDGWSTSPTPAVTAPAVDIFSGFTFTELPLPAGKYKFYFAIDGNADGLPDLTYLDRVDVAIGNR